MSRRKQAEKSSEAARIRLKILERDSWRCQFCGSRSNLHVHHIVYRSHGGPDSEDNLITLCAACHQAIHLGKRLLHKNSAGKKSTPKSPKVHESICRGDCL